MKIIIFGQKWLGEGVLKLAGAKNNVVGVVNYAGDRLSAAACLRKTPLLTLADQAAWPEADLGLAAHFHHRIPKYVLSRFRAALLATTLRSYPNTKANMLSKKPLPPEKQKLAAHSINLMTASTPGR